MSATSYVEYLTRRDKWLNWPASLLIAFFSHKIFELFFFQNRKIGMTGKFSLKLLVAEV